MRAVVRRVTLGVGLIALASPVVLLTDPTRQRAVADRLSPTVSVTATPTSDGHVPPVTGRRAR